jgi:hypothetical protein
LAVAPDLPPGLYVRFMSALIGCSNVGFTAPFRIEFNKRPITSQPLRSRASGLPAQPEKWLGSAAGDARLYVCPKCERTWEMTTDAPHGLQFGEPPG